MFDLETFGLPSQWVSGAEELQRFIATVAASEVERLLGVIDDGLEVPALLDPPNHVLGSGHIVGA